MRESYGRFGFQDLLAEWKSLCEQTGTPPGVPRSAAVAAAMAKLKKPAPKPLKLPKKKPSELTSIAIPA